MISLCQHCPLHPAMKPCRECAKPFRPKMPAHVYCSFQCSQIADARKYYAKKAQAKTPHAPPYTQ
jgi:hypothetical protein